jgi:hypothetical protein
VTRATLSELDARIGELRATVDRITENLAALDDDLTRQMLDASTSLRGRTLEAWAVARGGIEQLWQGQLALRDLLERLDRARGGRTTVSRVQAQTVVDLLDGPSVVLVTGSSRSLTEEPELTVQLTTADLLAAMSTTYDGIVAVVDRVAAVWSTTGPALAELDTRMRRLEEVATDSGEAAPNELAQARRALRDAEEQARCDPVDVDDDTVPAITRMVDHAATLLTDAVAARAALEDDRADTRSSLDRCSERLGEARAVCAGLAPKVAGSERWASELDRCADGFAALRTELDGSARTVSTPVALRNLLAGIRQRAGELDAEAAAVVRTARECVAARDELRGRIDAYRAKAVAVGRAEDLALDDAYARARDALYVAPCDVDEATRLTEAYQRDIRDGVRGAP